MRKFRRFENRLSYGVSFPNIDWNDYENLTQMLKQADRTYSISLLQPQGEGYLRHLLPIKNSCLIISTFTFLPIPGKRTA